MAGKLFCTVISLLIINFIKVYGQNQTCGGNVTAESGTISYPDANNIIQYKNNDDCVWLIIGKITNRIELSILHMDLEFDALCIYDYVKIYEGNALAITYCGDRKNPPAIQFHNSLVTIEFHSDDGITGTGFKIGYRQTEDFQCGGTELFIIGTMQALDEDKDGFYDNNIDCLWAIESINKSRQFYIAQMDVQWSPGCKADFLQIIEEDVHSETICGSERPPLYVMSTSTMYVRFHSDSSINGKGFLAVYANAGDQCGGILTRSEGVITPDDNDNDGYYDSNLICWWSVVAPEKMVVTFEITDLDIEATAECDADYILVHSYFGRSYSCTQQQNSHATIRITIWPLKGIQKSLKKSLNQASLKIRKKTSD